MEDFRILMISMLYKIKLNPFISMLAAGLLLMCLSAVSIDVVSVAYGYGFERFNMSTELSFVDLSTIEKMSEFTLPVAFIIGVFLAAGGMSGWLLIERQNTADYRLLA